MSDRRHEDPERRKQARLKEQDAQARLIFSDKSDEEKVKSLEARLNGRGLFYRPYYRELLKLRTKLQNKPIEINK